MAKKKKNFKETNIEDYYDLKVDKVEELVAILKGEDTNTENVVMDMPECVGTNDRDNYKKSGKAKKFNPYHMDKLSAVPTWIKAIFVKFWFAGCVCFFIIMGLGNYIQDDLDLMVLTGVVLGIIVDVLVNPIFHYTESDDKEYNNYMMFSQPFKSYWTFFTNIVYYVMVMIVVNFAYLGLNELINVIAGTGGRFNVGIEPLLFGVICVIVDMAFIGIKDGLVVLVRKMRKKELNNV